MDTRSTSDGPAREGRARAGRIRQPLEIGWREWAGLPEFGVDRIAAKIDTGAKTSAVHAYRVKETTRDGVPHAEFFLHPVQKRKRPEVFCVAPIVDRRRIRSSNGVLQERLVIETTLRLGGRAWVIELSLANRDAMGYRLLIGRDAMKKDILVRPSASFLLGD